MWLVESTHRYPLEYNSVIRISNILWPHLHLTTNYISQSSSSCNYYTDYNKVCSCTFLPIVLFSIITYSHELNLILNDTPLNCLYSVMGRSWSLHISYAQLWRNRSTNSAVGFWIRWTICFSLCSFLFNKTLACDARHLHMETDNAWG